MHTRFLSLLSRRLLLPVLLVGLALGSVSLALFQHTLSAHAAASSSHPSYVMVIGGLKYIAQYEGGAFNSDVTGHSIYTDFGHWNEYTVDRYGTWHWYGQFSGNENTYVNGYGQLQTGVNVTIPGVGHINTYPHETVINPPLTPAPYSFGPEHYLGERLGVRGPGIQEDCEVDASNVDTGHFGSGTKQFTNIFSQQTKDCNAADHYLASGDSGINTVIRHLPRAKSSTVASLLQPRLPFPVALGIAGGVAFIGSIATGNICNFTSCSNTARKILIGISFGLGIISGVLGISSGILTAMKAFAAPAAGGALAAAGAEAAGGVEMTGVVSAGLASRASSEASFVSALSHTSSISVAP